MFCEATCICPVATLMPDIAFSRAPSSDDITVVSLVSAVPRR
jgi:hypothetical protein